MNKIVSLGELLIDFQAKGAGTLKDCEEFVKKAGGAPANVCVQAVKLGMHGVYLTQVGRDAFGEFLVSAIEKEGVDTSFIKLSGDYDTSLAFVSFTGGGERQFSFYRRTAADLHFAPSDFAAVTFGEGDVFEFGSVALKTETARKTHDSLIDKARSSHALVCFDPNLRFNLWDDESELKTAVKSYALKSDVIKLGDGELEFLTHSAARDAAAEAFLKESGAGMLAVTRGSRGAKLYLRDGRTFDFGGYSVDAADTTGAGDSFFGGLIYGLAKEGITPETLMGEYDYESMLKFACACGSYTATGFGAMAAMGDRDTVSKAVASFELNKPL